MRPRERLLTVKGQAAPIGSRAFDVLVALIERAGRAVSRDELLLGEPCIVGDEIREFPTLHPPRLARPVAFIEGAPPARLLEFVEPSCAADALENTWSRMMPPRKAAASRAG